MSVKFKQTIRYGDRVFRTNRPKGSFAVIGEHMVGGKHMLNIRRGAVGYLVYEHIIDKVKSCRASSK